MICDMQTSHSLPVAVIGAGPIGLAAAAHLLERGETPIVFEMSESVAGNVRSWRHVRVFSRWADNIDLASKRLLVAEGWTPPPDEGLPTGNDLLTLYLEPLANTPVMSPHIYLGTRVVGIGRKNVDKMKEEGRDASPFIIRTVDRSGTERGYEARAVIDASGTWANPNPIGAGGLTAMGEEAAADRIFYGVPDVLGTEVERYRNRTVMVVGSGHSAFQVLLDLAKLREADPRAKIYWALRRRPAATTFGGGDLDELPARGALGQKLRSLVVEGGLTVLAPLLIERVTRDDDMLTVSGVDDGGVSMGATVDEIVAVTGSRPDFGFLREVRLDIDPAVEAVASIAPLIDPNVHSCGTVPPHGEAALRQPEKDFYIVGHKSYGRAPTFLMMTGYEQVRSVVAALSGDIEAARRVDLVLPDTGIELLGDDAVYGLEAALPQ
jgi:hypothetical protein